MANNKNQLDLFGISKTEKTKKKNNKKDYPSVTKNSFLEKDFNEVFSVAQFVANLNEVLASHKVIVQGEIFGNVNRRGGANYFTLKDKEEEVVLSCFAWQNIISKVGIELKEGMEVKIAGYPKIYPPTGRLSLQVQEIFLTGEGALKKALEELKKKLEEEGLFDTKYKKPLPRFIKEIGLITAKNREAQKDFLTHLGKWGFKVNFYDVRVEGVKAVDQISEAINWFNKYRPNIEALVVTRGGGGLESLQTFNSESVARAIFASNIPIVCGVGHENDFTVADMVADIRASTPTHAAKILSEDWQKADWWIREMTSSFLDRFENLMEDYKVSINQEASNLKNYIEKLILNYKNKLNSFLSHFRFYFQKNLERYQKIKSELFTNFKLFSSSVNKYHDWLNYYNQGVQNGMRHYLDFINSKIKQKKENLILSNPELKLKQGYSIAFDSVKGSVIKSVKSIKKGDILNLKFYDGKAKSKIEQIDNK